MDSLMQNSAYFGFFITLMGYWCAVQVGKRMRSTLCNPLLLSIIFIIKIKKKNKIFFFFFPPRPPPLSVVLAVLFFFY